MIRVKTLSKVKDVPKDGLDSVLKFIYTNNIQINSKNINEILHAATLLQVKTIPLKNHTLKIKNKVEPVIRFCCQYLQEEITLTIVSKSRIWRVSFR